ncbi:MAG: hypothetical protein COU46_03160 [Candidatus Niyogibacteria bacterium CG10_big_fil_rev_8_21_14_0_10_42_19]|uniref:Uncharacterized protein n=1 Tax=Candidatus Niyogibacteria bacterium CG10_big_fil_rev_8_21_14_0_10_42_19 TaxID=1974725 RepID=A0A2H0TH31_9BACT|nr:MAG: hypothetical protein COU46_03160 [Candidatus Niyogibacteria bacterium CG10_big_fil_rev_8_21_14_0_10_42_19]
MNSFFNFLMFFNILGILISLSSIAVVAHAASYLLGKLRTGMLSFIWGLAFIVLSFIWSMFDIYYSFGQQQLQIIFISIGMVLIFLASRQLFAVSG